MKTFCLCAAQYMEQCWIIVNWAISKKKLWKCLLQNGGYLFWPQDNAKAQNEWIQIALNTYNLSLMPHIQQCSWNGPSVRICTFPVCIILSCRYRLVLYRYITLITAQTMYDEWAQSQWEGDTCVYIICLHIVLWCFFMDVQLGVTVLQIRWINTLRPSQNGRHFPDDIFKCIFLNGNV